MKSILGGFLLAGGLSAAISGRAYDKEYIFIIGILVSLFAIELITETKMQDAKDDLKREILDEIEEDRSPDSHMREFYRDMAGLE